MRLLVLSHRRAREGGKIQQFLLDIKKRSCCSFFLIHESKFQGAGVIEARDFHFERFENLLQSL